MHEIYRNIKELRKDRGWSQTELAKKVGYADKGMISRIEHGKVDLSQSQVVKFAEVFGLTPGELLGPEGTAPKTGVVELNVTPMVRTLSNNVKIDNPPGILEVRRLYTLFDQQDRDEILSIMRIKAQKYQ